MMTLDPDTGIIIPDYHRSSLKENHILEEAEETSLQTLLTVEETAWPVLVLIDKESPPRVMTFYTKIFTWKTFTRL